MDPGCEDILLNPGLLRISQDRECRPPQIVYRGRILETHPEDGGWHEHPDCGLTMFKHLSDGEFAVAYFNFAPAEGNVPFIFADAGLPYTSGFGLRFRDAVTGEDLGLKRDYFNLDVEAHGCRVFLARLEAV